MPDTLDTLNYDFIKLNDNFNYKCPYILEEIADRYPPDIKVRGRDGNWYLLYTTKDNQSVSIIAVYSKDKKYFQIFFNIDGKVHSMGSLMKKKNFEYKSDPDKRTLEFIQLYLFSSFSF